MSTNALRVVIPTLGVLFNTGLTVSGYVNPTVAYVLWAAMVPIALGALFWPRISVTWGWLRPRLRRIRFRSPVTLAPTHTGLRPTQHFSVPAEVIDTLTPQKAKEIEEERQALNKEIKRLSAENELLRKQATPQLNELKALCLHLSHDLNDLRRWFYASQSQIVNSLEEEQKAGTLEKDIEEERLARERVLEDELQKRYHEDYRDRILKLYDQLAPRNWFGANDRRLFETLEDPYDLMAMAYRLERVGKLP